MTINVKFELNDYNWDLVITMGAENKQVISEDGKDFIVAYPSQQDLDTACVRIEDLCPYEIINE
jgi:hypothetical protein